MNTVDLVDNTSSTPIAERLMREFSAPSNTNVPTRTTMTVGDRNFELKPVFSGKPNEDSNAHLQHFGRCVGLSLSVE
jgi:hypothetical protein